MLRSHGPLRLQLGENLDAVSRLRIGVPASGRDAEGQLMLLLYIDSTADLAT